MNLDAPLTSLKGIGPRRAELLGKLGLFSVNDLLRFAPRDYLDYSRIVPAAKGVQGQDGAFLLTLSGPPRLAYIPGRRLNVLTVTGQDASGKLTLTWYNQPFRKDQLQAGRQVCACGRMDRSHGARLINPALYPACPGILPVYPLTRGLSQNLLREAVRTALSFALPDLKDPMPPSLLKKYGLLPLQSALPSLHFPATQAALQQARRRLAFEDILLFRLMLSLLGSEQEGMAVRPVDGAPAYRAFLRMLPFTPTGAQQRAMADIMKDLASGKAMNRLIQGDVGSGKTAVAFFAMYAIMAAGKQAALMAPTEILARQHYEKLAAILGPERIRLVLGGMKKAQREEAWAALSTGEASLAIGTHALLREEGMFQSLALVVTDEQHRFGVGQRAAIQSKGQEGLHVLVMSATPIPRTLALLLYGDLQVSRIDELPPGRKPIATRLVPPSKRKDMYNFIQAQAATGQQAYIVCPLVEESEELPGVPGAVQLYQRLHKAYPTLALGLLHGQMPSREKEAVAADFRAGRIRVLVATTVIEVGVDVPAATIMAIEHADRFGLAQLHQLRGRVGRGKRDSYCFLLCSPEPGDGAAERLAILCDSQDGFAIAEADLAMRGPGEFLGKRQHGLSEFEAAHLAMDLELLEEAQAAAQDILAHPAPQYRPLLALAKARLASLREDIVGN